MADLNKTYQERKNEIDSRLNEFQDLKDADNERIFKELVFVILTSQSKAKKCWEATEKLDELSLLKNGSTEEIAEILRRHDIQYEENKASYIVKNRRKLSQPTLEDPSGSLKIRRRIDGSNIQKTREQLVEELHGVGWKGASHFLRNIGYGDSLAIISGYIAEKLHKMGKLETPEPPKDKQEYLEAEEKLQELSRETGIDIQELDLVIWSMETGEAFK